LPTVVFNKISSSLESEELEESELEESLDLEFLLLLEFLEFLEFDFFWLELDFLDF